MTEYPCYPATGLVAHSVVRLLPAACWGCKRQRWTPYLAYCLTPLCFHYHLDESIFILRDVMSIFSLSFHFSMKFVKANRIASNGTPHFSAHLGLFCLPMSHKRGRQANMGQWRFGYENISTATLPLPLSQEEKLSVKCERMYAGKLPPGGFFRNIVFSMGLSFRSSLIRVCTVCEDIFMYLSQNLGLFQPRYEKTGFLHMRKQRHRSFL